MFAKCACPWFACPLKLQGKSSPCVSDSFVLNSSRHHFVKAIWCPKIPRKVLFLKPPSQESSAVRTEPTRGPGTNSSYFHRGRVIWIEITVEGLGNCLVKYLFEESFLRLAMADTTLERKEEDLVLFAVGYSESLVSKFPCCKNRSAKWKLWTAIR